MDLGLLLSSSASRLSPMTFRGDAIKLGEDVVAGGYPLQGFFEVTAVPHLRAQARSIAALLARTLSHIFCLKSMHSKRVGSLSIAPKPSLTKKSLFVLEAHRVRSQLSDFDSTSGGGQNWRKAEPVAALYEQGNVDHVGSFPELEDEMCTREPLSGMPSTANNQAADFGICQ